MILIADCGSTKIDWCLLNGKEKVAQIFTTGMNALLMTQDEMTARIKEELMPHISGYQVDEIYYYGAGIISDEIKSHVANALKANMPAASKIEVDTDLLGRGTQGLTIAHDVALGQALLGQLAHDLHHLGVVSLEEGHLLHVGARLVAQLLHKVHGISSRL